MSATGMLLGFAVGASTANTPVACGSSLLTNVFAIGILVLIVLITLGVFVFGAWQAVRDKNYGDRESGCILLAGSGFVGIVLAWLGIVFGREMLQTLQTWLGSM